MKKKLGICIVVVAIVAVFFLGQMTERTPAPAPVHTPSPSSVSISGVSYLLYPAVIGAIAGAIAGAIVSSALMYLLYNWRFKKERRRELLEKRLEKLYSPLYTFTKRLKEENELAIEKDIPRIVELIEKNCYLASEELQPFLTLMVSYDRYGQDMMREAQEEAGKMFELIKKEYNKFRAEYFACK